ncbi:MAG: DUF5682 family protein [Neomegalonema sp.]|nr:DUF5682 family protein [Neomegalonema sp.]
MDRLTVLGIRHHGPGSARAVAAALALCQPEAVLIEGPPEAEGVLALAADPGMMPPVALLVSEKRKASEVEAGRARFYPFAAFSPEWVALRWALEHGAVARMIDLPVGIAFALDAAGAPDEEAPGGDPLAALARVEGRADPEGWWQDLIEERAAADPLALFAALEQAMAAVRAAEPVPARDALREAHMRREIRKALREVSGPVAVICGAYHAPALRGGSTREDTAALKGLPKMAVEAAWVPWSASRLTLASGYGAGLQSPGWAAHLWEGAPDSAARWQVKIARLLRAEGLDASSASAIEAARLAQALAALRGRAAPGLSEMRDAALSALCHGEPAPLRLITERLEVGEQLGRVPDNAPLPPLFRDIERWQRRLRLKPEASARALSLDLRSEAGGQRSLLLRRLALLGVRWGTLTGEETGRGTFREEWQLEWQPEFAATIADAAIYGPSLLEAAQARLIEQAGRAQDLAVLAGLLAEALMADLPQALASIEQRLMQRAAQSGEVLALMAALPPIAKALRYGSARDLPQAALRGLCQSLMRQICAGLPPSTHGLDEQAARALRDLIRGSAAALQLLEEAALSELWAGTLASIAGDTSAAPLLRGHAVRAGLDAGGDKERCADLLAMALSRSVPVMAAGLWLEGFLAGPAAVLIHDARLFGLIDAWLCALKEAELLALLPVIRRATASFSASERAQVMARLKGGGASSAPAGAFDPARVAAALPLLKRMLGHKEGGA